MPPSRSATQLALILPLKARLELTDAERDELVRALRRIVENDQFSCRRGFGACGRSSTSWSPRSQRASRSRAEAAGRPQTGVEPAAAALTWLTRAISVVCCYRLETQTRSRTQRANANSAASAAAETVLAMNQNISKPS